MFLDEKDQINVKIYDFQSYTYESFALDLILFLFTSVPKSDLKMNFTLFVDYYISEFQKTMTLVKSPMDDYTQDK